jgi:hypothetical protein
MIRVNSIHHTQNQESMDLLLSFLIKFSRGDFNFRELIKMMPLQRVYGEEGKKVSSPTIMARIIDSLL